MKRRLISSILVMAMILSMVSIGFAAPATYSDINSDDVTNAVAELGALNIIRGYNDDTFKPDNNITRAEFAAIAVRELGIDDAAVGIKAGSTQFADVAANHWAAGYVNVANNQGIIKGYADGTFRPDANVSYAEAVAMLVRVANWEIAVKGNWPTNYLAAGADAGITDGVVGYGPNELATRGMVALMAKDTLHADKLVQKSFGSEEKFEKDAKVLADNFDVTDYDTDTKVVKTPKMEEDFDNTIEVAKKVNDKTEFEVADESKELYDDAYLDTLFGKEINVWLNDDDEIVYIAIATNTTDIIVDKVESDADTAITVDASDNVKGTVKLDDADKTYDLDKVTITVNNKVIVKDGTVEVGQGEADGNDIEALIIGHKGTFVKDSGDIVSMDLTNYDNNTYVVTSVKKDDYIKGKNDVGNTHKTDIEDKDLTIVKDGSEIDVTDIEEDDVVHVIYPVKWVADVPGTPIVPGYYDYDDGVDNFTVLVTDEKVEGTLGRYIDSGKKVYVDGTKYKLAAEAVIKIKSNEQTLWSGSSVVTSQLNKVVNEEVTAYLNAEGKIRLLVADEANAVDNIAIVKSIYMDQGIDNTPQIKLLTVADTSITLDITDDTEVTDTVVGGTYDADKFDDYDVVDAGNTEALFVTDKTTKAINKFDVVDYELTNDGQELKSIEVIGRLNGDDTAVSSIVRDFDEDNNRIKYDVDGVLGSDKWLVVSDDTVFFNNTESTSGNAYDFEATTWANVKNATDGKKVVAVVEEDNGNRTDSVRLSAVIVCDVAGGVGSDYEVATVLNIGYDGSDDVVDILVNDETKTDVVLDNSVSGLAEGDTICYRWKDAETIKDVELKLDTDTEGTKIIDEITTVGSLTTIEFKKADGSYNGEIQVNDATQFIDYSGDDPEAIELGDIGEDDTIQYKDIIDDENAKATDDIIDIVILK